MRPYRAPVTLITACLVISGCESTSPKVELTDATVNSDIAVSAGEAMTSFITTMIGNESSGAFAGLVAPVDGGYGNAVTTNRTTTCYDISNAVMTSCTPLANVRKVVSHVTLSGTRSRTDTVNSSVRTFTGAVHRVADDTMVRNFNGSTETSRTHNAVGTANDTTTFTESDMTRVVSESAVDSVKSVVFAIPRTGSPASGSIVRNSTVKITLTKGTASLSRSVTRRITITFPADANGNVVMTIDGRTCALNLATGRVGTCS